ncbi:MAG TPA: energy-coupling factor transporter transmembrane component T [bacterium]|nr:energy-coupling factor transporter transmembrane component T [bacterium]
MSSGFYADRSSFFHRLHPVTRILLLLLAFVSALMIEHPLPLLALALIYGLAAARTGVFGGLRRVIWLLVLVAAASFLIWSAAYSGKNAVFALGPLTVTYEGMIYGAGMGLRLDLMIFCGLIFLAATRVEEFTYGLTRLGLPFSVSFALSLSFRLAPMFADTVGTILEAQRSRGLDTEAGGVVKRLKSYVPLLAPVFAAALRRADQLAIALESKGFGLGHKRGSFREYEAGARDGAAMALMAALIALEIMARRAGWWTI